MGEHIAAIESGQRALTIASALKEVALQAATTIYLGIARGRKRSGWPRRSITPPV